MAIKILPPDELVTAHVPERSRPDPENPKGERIVTAAGTFSAPALYVDTAIRQHGTRSVASLRATVEDRLDGEDMSHVTRKATFLVIIAALEHELDLVVSGAVRP